MTEFNKSLARFIEEDISLGWIEDANKKKEHISLFRKKHKMKYNFFGTSIVLVH